MHGIKCINYHGLYASKEAVKSEIMYPIVCILANDNWVAYFPGKSDGTPSTSVLKLRTTVTRSTKFRLKKVEESLYCMTESVSKLCLQKSDTLEDFSITCKLSPLISLLQQHFPVASTFSVKLVNFHRRHARIQKLLLDGLQNIEASKAL